MMEANVQANAVCAISNEITAVRTTTYKLHTMNEVKGGRRADGENGGGGVGDGRERGVIKLKATHLFFENASRSPSPYIRNFTGFSFLPGSTYSSSSFSRRFRFLIAILFVDGSALAAGYSYDASRPFDSSPFFWRSYIFFNSTYSSFKYALSFFVIVYCRVVASTLDWSEAIHSCILSASACNLLISPVAHVLVLVGSPLTCATFFLAASARSFSAYSCSDACVAVSWAVVSSLLTCATSFVVVSARSFSACSCSDACVVVS